MSALTVAALFVQADGVYAGLAGVELWDVARDARAYGGPHPVVAHPPCARWCRLAGSVEARGGARRGDDGGCFAAALAAVRQWGGVLEHPESSAAWAAFGLLRPWKMGWSVADECGGWTCRVEQQRYGHRARKATWLYACGVDLPSLRWGRERSRAPVYMQTPRAVHEGRSPRLAVALMGHRERMATPLPFAELLVSIARTARTTRENT